MRFTLTFYFILLSVAVFAQKRIVTGTIISTELQSVLPGVTVISEQESTISDQDGRFTVSAMVNGKITFSFVGMKTTTILVNTSSEPVSVSMEYETLGLNEVVVTGYQSQKKADLTGVVSVVKTSDIKDVPLGNPIKALQGRIPGVYITTNGSPGGGATVRIRGMGTIGNNNPLYVIDGMPTERGLNEINQADIETMQVLKDASSASIYGSRAANGVIIITTQKGKNGVTKIDLNSSFSVQQYVSKIKVLNTEERGRAYWQAAINDGSGNNPNTNQTYKYDWNGDYSNPVLNKIILPEFVDAAKTMRPADTQWFNEISQLSMLKSTDLTLSSGTEKGHSLFSLSHYDNSGIIRGSSLKRITARVNSEYRLFNSNLTIGENLSATHSVGTAVQAETSVDLSLLAQPIIPVHTIDGGWGGPGPGMTDRQNPVRLIEDGRRTEYTCQC